MSSAEGELVSLSFISRWMRCIQNGAYVVAYLVCPPRAWMRLSSEILFAIIQRIYEAARPIKIVCKLACSLKSSCNPPIFASFSPQNPGGSTVVVLYWSPAIWGYSYKRSK